MAIIQDLVDHTSQNYETIRYSVLIGDAYFADGAYATADQYYQKVFSFVKAENSPLANKHYCYARALMGSARILAVHKDLGSAESAARKGMDILRNLLAPDDRRLASSLFVLGEILMAQSRYEDAEIVLHECLEIRRNTLTDQHSLTAAAQCMHNRCLAALEIDGSS